MASAFSFFKNFGKEQAGNVGQSIMEKIVGWDPETASKAEIETMIEDLDNVTREAGQAKATWNKTQGEADAAKANYDRQVKAADILNQQLEAAKAAGVPYMTYYMRLRFGMHPRTAAVRPVRKYRKAA